MKGREKATSPRRVRLPPRHSGKRQVVIVDLGDGRFQPREVKAGRRGEHYVAIVEGLEAGENIVVSANFLIDAESNLRAALSSFSDDAEKPASHGASHDAHVPAGEAMP